MLGYRLRCRIGSRQISAGEHQQGQYDVARLLIAEASVAPAALDAVRGTVLNIIGALRNAYAHTLAEDLDRQLSDAIRAAREAPVIRGTSLGTGFVVRPNGVLLTAHHVVRGAKTITVKCLDRPATEATLVAAVPNNDLAVLRLASAADLPYLPVAPPRSARVGDHVFTGGFPASGILGHEAKFTEGSISAMSGPGGEATFMQISVPIQPGNSGGPLVSESGEVVGVVTATAAVEAFLAATGSLPQNVNFAVKGEYTLPLFEEPARVSPPAGRRDAIDRALRATCAIEAKP
jgi:S1-C subfamily serine protease